MAVFFKISHVRARVAPMAKRQFDMALAVWPARLERRTSRILRGVAAGPDRHGRQRRQRCPAYTRSRIDYGQPDVTLFVNQRQWCCDWAQTGVNSGLARSLGTEILGRVLLDLFLLNMTIVTRNSSA